MGYRLLGKAVWNAGRWYLRRRYPRLGRNVTLAGVGAVVLVAVGVVARRRPAPELS